MKRWLVMSLGFAIAAAAVYGLLSGPMPGDRQAALRSSAPAEEIDAGSRERLRQILRDEASEGVAQ